MDLLDLLGRLTVGHADFKTETEREREREGEKERAGERGVEIELLWLLGT